MTALQVDGARLWASIIGEAGEKGADITGFGETRLPEYPFFAFSTPSQARWDAAQEYIGQAIEIPGPETDQLCTAARAAGTDVVTLLLALALSTAVPAHWPTTDAAHQATASRERNRSNRNLEPCAR